MWNLIWEVRAHTVLEVKPKLLLPDEMMNWNPHVKRLIQSNTGVRMLTTVISVHRYQKGTKGANRVNYEHLWALKDTAMNPSKNLNSHMSFAPCILWLGTTVGEITHKGTLPSKQRLKSKCMHERSWCYSPWAGFGGCLLCCVEGVEFRQPSYCTHSFCH